MCHAKRPRLGCANPTYTAQSMYRLTCYTTTTIQVKRDIQQHEQVKLSKHIVLLEFKMFIQCKINLLMLSSRRL